MATLTPLLLLEAFQLCDLFRGLECRKSEWEKEETGWHSFLPLTVDAQWICCCLAHPLVPWGWEELKLRSLWRLVLVGSRSFLCLVNSYALGWKLTARARLGLWALGSESQACTLQKSEPKSKENDEIPSLAKMLLFHQGQPSSLAQGVDLIVLM